MFGKKSIKNMSMLDLRAYSGGALAQISSIQNVATVVLPEAASPDFVEAYTQIKKRNIAQELSLSPDMQLHTVNGNRIMTGSTVHPEFLYILNGFAVLHSIPQDICVHLLVNGFVVVQKGVRVDAVTINGSMVEVDLNTETMKVYNNTLLINSAYIDEIEAGTTIIAGNRLEINGAVTAQEIIDKDLHFVVGNRIICDEIIAGCVRARSTVGNKIETR